MVSIPEDPPAVEPERIASLEEDEKAKALLVAYVADSHLEYIRDKQTAGEMWTLKKILQLRRTAFDGVVADGGRYSPDELTPSV